MTVLTLAGKPIDWAKPPKPTAKVLWSQRTQGGSKVLGSFRTIAQLERLNILAVAKFGISIVVIQGPFNTGVKASAGTHDFDAAKDVKIPGVPWAEQQTFFRKHGEGAYHRTPAQGFTDHIHMFTLPPREGNDVSDDYRSAGFKVGIYIDGGWSSKGRAVSSSQIADYYAHKDALKDHHHDPSWFPASIAATIFDLPAFIKAQQATTGEHVTVATNNIMSLPRNKHVAQTLTSIPLASVVGVQEADIFHKEVQQVPGYDCMPIPAGDTYDSVVLYKPDVWDYRAHAYEKLYDGAGGVSKTRHVAILRLRHRALNQDVVFISYHDVTKGEDSIRKGLRRKGRKVVREIVRRHLDLGQPVFVLADTNQGGTVYRTADLVIKHGIDHIYAWDGRHVVWSLLSSRAKPTTSDHDALTALLLARLK